MKKLLIFALLIASTSAQANGDPVMCAQLGNIYSIAIRARNTGNSPEQTLKYVSGATALSLETRKKVVNDVFFEPGLAHENPDRVQDAVFKACFYQAKEFKLLE